MFFHLATTSLLAVTGALGQSTVSAWFPIFGDGELWINTDKPMEASIVAIVIVTHFSDVGFTNYDRMELQRHWYRNAFPNQQNSLTKRAVKMMAEVDTYTLTRWSRRDSVTPRQFQLVSYPMLTE
jgi:hypothetical protein